jgi:hypothetical protein
MQSTKTTIVTSNIVFVAFAVALGSACNKSDTQGESVASTGTARIQTKTFKCRKIGPGQWRECAPSLSRCDQSSCFEREEAFCFPILMTSIGDLPETKGMICTPTERECEEWNEDRKHVRNRSLGPCVLARPDEYLEQE